jgi:hypothetical protein
VPVVRTTPQAKAAPSESALMARFWVVLVTAFLACAGDVVARPIGLVLLIPVVCAAWRFFDGAVRTLEENRAACH